MPNNVHVIISRDRLRRICDIAERNIEISTELIEKKERIIRDLQKYYMKSPDISKGPDLQELKKGITKEGITQGEVQGDCFSGARSILTVMKLALFNCRTVFFQMDAYLESVSGAMSVEAGTITSKNPFLPMVQSHNDLSTI